MRPRQIVLLLAAFVVAGVAYWGPPSDSSSGGGGSDEGRVIRVVDGDTIHVMVDGQDESVRYIGIDTPESVKPGTPVQCFAKAASARKRAAKRTSGGIVSVRANPRRTSSAPTFRPSLAR